MDSLQDENLFKYVADAVREGIDLVLKIKAQNKYIGTHLFWPSVSYKENGLPNFSTPILSGPIDYGQAFGRTDNSLINYSLLPSYQALFDYFRNNEYLVRHYSGKQDNINIDDSFLYFVIHVVNQMIDRYIHLNGEQEFTTDSLRPMYTAIENGICNSKLKLDIFVPILFVGFDFDELFICDGIAIGRMSDDIQVARSLNREHSYTVNKLVADAATHAVVFVDYEVENRGFWSVNNSLSEISSYPTEKIDLFFAALRTVTGIQTGYGQIMTRLVGWAMGYDADLPPIKGVRVRAYPNSFDKNYFSFTVPVISEQKAKEIGILYSKMIDVGNSKILIAARRLNACFLRDNDEDTILDATIALETLFSDDGRTEMTHKLAMRVAALSKLSLDMRFTPFECFKIIKQIYSYRSAIVHGSNNTSKSKELTINETRHSTIDLAVELLQRMLIVLLENPTYLEPVKIDEELLLRENTAVSDSTLDSNE